jgi:hypothetical protein
MVNNRRSEIVRADNNMPARHATRPQSSGIVHRTTRVQRARSRPETAEWGGWGSNPRPADYENYGPAHRAHCLHGCHGAVPPMALIAQLAHIARSTSRSTPYHGDHRMSATESHRRLGLICQGYGRRATWSIWTIPPFFVDRGEDAVPPGPQPQQIRRPARERLRQPPGGFGPSRQNCEFVCRAIHAAT